MTRAANVLLVGYAVYVLVTVIAIVRRRRKLAKMLAGRPGGVEAFAASLGRSAADVVVRATYAALVSDGRTRLERVRAADELRLYGIMDEDAEELVAAAARALHAEDRLPAYVRTLQANGRTAAPKTPAGVVQFLDGLVAGAPSRPRE